MEAALLLSRILVFLLICYIISLILKPSPKKESTNDLAYLGKMKKVFRQERAERFEDVLPKLNDSDKVTSITYYEVQGKYTIVTNTKFGIVDYYPKANKVLIRKDNDWRIGGLRWLYLNLISL